MNHDEQVNAAMYQDFETRDPDEWELREDEADRHLDSLKATFPELATVRSAGGPGSGNFHHAGRPGEVGGSAAGSYAAFEKQALVNLDQTSRTAGGVSDTSSSASKPKLNIEGGALAAKSRENFQEALGYVWHSRYREFQSPEEVKTFANDVAATVSRGLLQPTQSPFRTWETKNNQLKPDQIPAALDKFAEELHGKLSRGEDSVKTAAWLEKRLAVVHPWADGSGRTTKALSAMVLARGGKNLPTYPKMGEYYDAVRSQSDADFAKTLASWIK